MRTIQESLNARNLIYKPAAIWVDYPTYDLIYELYIV